MAYLSVLSVYAESDKVRQYAYGAQSAETLIINEVMPSNLDMFVDKSGDYGGYIEFYNPTEQPVRLLGLFISDDANNLYKFRLKATAGYVPAYGHTVVWFDHNGTGGSYFDDSSAQVPWKLDYDGGTIYVCNKDSQLIIEQEYPAAISRVSWSRKTDGGDEWGYTAQPTPGATNEGALFCNERVPAPVPDKDGQLFSSSFTLHVNIPSESTLVYTTDGSTPTLTNGEVSRTGALRVNSGASRLFRFRAFREGCLPSEVVTRSYIYRDKEYTLPVVSIVSNYENFYGDSLGIFVKGLFTNYNKDWDRPVNFEFIDTDNKCLLNQECDVAMAGAYSRNFDPRPFRLKANKLYEGRNYFDAQLFPLKRYLRQKSLKFRNGGNDVTHRITDGAIQMIIQRSDFYLDGQLWQPTHVFLNGKYHGMLNMREPTNKFFAYANYGIDTDNVDLFEIDPSLGYVQSEGDKEAYLEWYNLTFNAADEAVYEQICSMVDIDEYCNYMAAEIWLGSNDWISNDNNTKAFRERVDGGKFHYVMYDVDASFSYTDLFTHLTGRLDDNRYLGGKNYVIQSFFNLLQNDTFRKKFITAYCLVAGSVFSPERSKNIINEMMDLVRPALALEGYSPDSKGRDLIEKISNNDLRSSRMKALANYFGLSNSHTVVFSSNLPEARFLLNGEYVPTSKFEGVLYGPQTIEAFAPAGYKFVGWRKKSDGSIVSTTRIFNHPNTKSETFTAEFTPVGDDERQEYYAYPVVVNEVSASNSVFVNEYFKRNDWVELYNNTSEPVDVSGMYLTDNPYNLEKYQLSDADGIETIIPAHGHLVIWCDKLDSEKVLHAPFKLANDDGKFVCLTAADKSWTNALRYNKHDGKCSVGRFPDGGYSVYSMTRPTIGESNVYTSQACRLRGENADFFEDDFRNEPTLIGDADNDGVVTMTDAHLVVNAYIDEDYSLINKANADVVADGEITMADACAIANIFVNE